jgi:hypothetical protein
MFLNLFAALYTKHAKRLGDIVIYSLPCSTILFHILTQKALFPKEITEPQMCFDFLYNGRPKHFPF